MSTRTTTGAAGATQPTVSPGVELAQQAQELGNLLGRFSYVTKFEALVLVRAAQNLADCHRVLSDIEDHLRLDPAFDAAVKEACVSACNPQSVGLDSAGPFEIIQELLRVAGDMLTHASDDMEAAESTARRLGILTKGEQA